MKQKPTLPSLLPTPAVKEPGWKNRTPVDKDGKTPTHHNQRWYDKETGRLMQKGLDQVLRLSQAASPASPSPQPDEEEARQTTAISGRKCLKLYEMSNPTGSSLRTCVASLLGTKAWYSNKCALTWKAKVTKSNRLLFQLSPSTRRIGEIESGLLPTAKATEHRWIQQQNSDTKLEQSHEYDSNTQQERWGERLPEGAGARTGSRPERYYENNPDTLNPGLEGRSQESQGQHRQSDRTRSNEGWDWNQNWFEVAAELCLVDDGLSSQLVRLPDGTEISYAKWRKESLKAGGNAIVPQVAMEIFKAMKAQLASEDKLNPNSKGEE